MVKFRVDHEGSVQKTTIEAKGRKVPLLDLRKQMLKDHQNQKLMRCHPHRLIDYVLQYVG